MTGLGAAWVTVKLSMTTPFLTKHPRKEKNIFYMWVVKGSIGNQIFDPSMPSGPPHQQVILFSNSISIWMRYSNVKELRYVHQTADARTAVLISNQNFSINSAVSITLHKTESESQNLALLWLLLCKGTDISFCFIGEHICTVQYKCQYIYHG